MPQGLIEREQGGNRLVFHSGSEFRGETGAAFRIDGSQAKFFNRDAGTTDAFCVQVKSEPANVNSSHIMIEGTMDAEPASASTSGYGATAILGAARLQASKTIGAGSLIGVYGQLQVNGTVNGSGVMATCLYGLVEEGTATFTALSHLSNCWLDSHRNDTVSAGHTEFLYVSNNGSATYEQVMYIYGGNKTTNWAAFDTCGTMIGDTDGAGASKYINVTIDGVAYRIAARAVA